MSVTVWLLKLQDPKKARNAQIQKWSGMGEGGGQVVADLLLSECFWWSTRRDFSVLYDSLELKKNNALFLSLDIL